MSCLINLGGIQHFGVDIGGIKIIRKKLLHLIQSLPIKHLVIGQSIKMSPNYNPSDLSEERKITTNNSFNVFSIVVTLKQEFRFYDYSSFKNLTKLYIIGG